MAPRADLLTVYGLPWTPASKIKHFWVYSNTPKGHQRGFYFKFGGKLKHFQLLCKTWQCVCLQAGGSPKGRTQQCLLTPLVPSNQFWVYSNASKGHQRGSRCTISNLEESLKLSDFLAKPNNVCVCKQEETRKANLLSVYGLPWTPAIMICHLSWLKHYPGSLTRVLGSHFKFGENFQFFQLIRKTQQTWCLQAGGGLKGRSPFLCTPLYPSNQDFTFMSRLDLQRVLGSPFK